MSKDNVSEWVKGRWEQQTRPEYNSLLTQHLPTGVVEQDVSIAVGAFTDPDNHRGGIIRTGVALGTRVNEEWTADEAEYIVATLLQAARRVWERYGDDRPYPAVPGRATQGHSPEV